MTALRWCEVCESIQPEDGLPCLGCERRREEQAADRAKPVVDTSSTPPRKAYVVQRLYPSLKVAGKTVAWSSIQPGCVGALYAFSSRKAARAFHPTARISMIQTLPE